MHMRNNEARFSKFIGGDKIINRPAHNLILPVLALPPLPLLPHHAQMSANGQVFKIFHDITRVYAITQKNQNDKKIYIYGHYIYFLLSRRDRWIPNVMNRYIQKSMSRCFSDVWIWINTENTISLICTSRSSWRGTINNDQNDDNNNNLYYKSRSKMVC